jgi:hypothetical protein
VEGAPLLEAEEIHFAIRCYTGTDVMPDDVRAAPLLLRPILFWPTPMPTRKFWRRPACRWSWRWPGAWCTASFGPGA